MLVFPPPLASLSSKFGRIAPALAAWVAIAVPNVASAQEARSGFSLETWQVPEFCGEREHFEARVSEAVGDWPEHLPAVHVQVRVTRNHREFVLVLQTQGASGEGRRELRAGTCEELLATGAVVLSLALDSEALMSNELTHEVVSASRKVKAEQVPPVSKPRGVLDDETPILHARDEESSTPISRASESLDTTLRLSAVTEVGTLPRAALGLGIVASAHSGPYRVAFRLIRWAEQVQFVGTNDRRGGSFDLLSGSLHLCRESRHGSAFVGLCAIGSVARISATGIAYTPQSAVNVLVSPGIGAFHDIPMGPTHIRVHGEAAVHISRPRYLLNEDMDTQLQVHQPSIVAVRLGMSWGLSF